MLPLLIEKPDYQPCEWQANGMRCKYPGSLSSGLLGGGPWYCSAHFACADPVIGAQVVERSQSYVWEHPRERYLKRPIPPLIPMDLKGDGLDWARRIMLRLDRGEVLPHISGELARAALGLTDPKPPERQPGQDDDEREVAA